MRRVLIVLGALGALVLTSAAAADLYARSDREDPGDAVDRLLTRAGGHLSSSALLAAARLSGDGFVVEADGAAERFDDASAGDIEPALGRALGDLMDGAASAVQRSVRLVDADHAVATVTLARGGGGLSIPLRLDLVRAGPRPEDPWQLSRLRVMR